MTAQGLPIHRPVSKATWRQGRSKRPRPRHRAQQRFAQAAYPRGSVPMMRAPIARRTHAFLWAEIGALTGPQRMISEVPSVGGQALDSRGPLPAGSRQGVEPLRGSKEVRSSIVCGQLCVNQMSAKNDTSSDGLPTAIGSSWNVGKASQVLLNANVSGGSPAIRTLARGHEAAAGGRPTRHCDRRSARHRGT